VSVVVDVLLLVLVSAKRGRLQASDL